VHMLTQTDIKPLKDISILLGATQQNDH
jgi:hypothetical protein